MQILKVGVSAGLLVWLFRQVDAARLWSAVGAASWRWLGVAALNWLQRAALLGGIYGRPVVLANLTLYFVSALSLLRVLMAGAAPRVLWVVLLLAAVLAAAYGALLVRGPFNQLRPPAS